MTLKISFFVLPVFPSKAHRARPLIHPSHVNIIDIHRTYKVSVPRSFTFLANENTMNLPRHLREVLVVFSVSEGHHILTILHAFVEETMTAQCRFCAVGFLLLTNSISPLHHQRLDLLQGAPWGATPESGGPILPHICCKFLLLETTIVTVFKNLDVLGELVGNPQDQQFST